MTNPQIDPTPHAPDDPTAAGRAPAITASAEDGVGRPARSVRAMARTGASAVRHGMTGLAARLPATLRVTRAGASRTVGALQTLPDATLRSLAATSVALGAGLSLTRAGRLATVAGMVPAVVMGTAILVRPVAPILKEGSADAQP
jgi:hypothetical protein